MKRLLSISILFLIYVGIALAVNETNSSQNQTITINDSSTNNTLINKSFQNDTINTSYNNKSIIIDLKYKTGSIFDPDDDGIEFITGVIDFSVENTAFNWQVAEAKLCTRWEIYSLDSGKSTTVCYGNQQCCNFVNLIPTRSNWSETFYLTYGLHNANHNNTVSAQIIYVDYNLSLENPYAEIVYSNWSTLSARFVEPTTNVFTKITRLVSAKLLVIRGAILQLEAKLSLVNDSPLPFETIDLYKNETLITSKLTDTSGFVLFDINTATLIAGEYIFSFNFSGREFIDGQQTIKYTPTSNITQLEVLPQIERNISTNLSQSNNTVVELLQEPAKTISKFKLYSKEWIIERGNSITKDVDYTFDLINDTAYLVTFRVNDDVTPKLRHAHGILKIKDSAVLDNYKKLIRLNISDKILDRKGKLDCSKVNCNQIEEYIQTNYGISLAKNDADELVNISQLYARYKKTYDVDSFVDDVLQMPSTPVEELSNKGLTISSSIHNLYEGSGSLIVNLPKPWYELDSASIKFGFNSTIASFKGADYSGNISFRDINSTARYVNISSTAIVKNATIVMAGFVNLTKNMTWPNGAWRNGEGKIAWNGTMYHVLIDTGMQYELFIVNISQGNLIGRGSISDNGIRNDELWNFSFIDPCTASATSGCRYPQDDITFNGSTLWYFARNENVTYKTNFPTRPIGYTDKFSLGPNTRAIVFVNGTLWTFDAPDNSSINISQRDENNLSKIAKSYRVNYNPQGPFLEGDDFEWDGLTFWIVLRSGSYNTRLDPNNFSVVDAQTIAWVGDDPINPTSTRMFIWDGTRLIGFNGNTDADIWFGRGFPFNLYINVGNDSTVEYVNLSENRKITSTIYLNGSSFNDYISANCGTGPNCFVPMVFNSTAGEWAYSNIVIEYDTKPKNPAMYVNGTLIWNVSGTFTGPTTIEGFDDEINNSLKSCTSVNNSCNISLTFFSDGESMLELSLLNIQYRDYDKEPPIIYGIFVKPNPAPKNSVINISVNASDNVNISLVTAKLEASEKNLTYNDTTKLYEGTLNTPSTVGNYNITATVTDFSNLSTTSSDISTAGTLGSGGCTGFCVQSSGGTNGIDLTLSSKDIALNATNPTENDSIRINATIFNFGNVSTSSFTVEFKVDGISKGSNSLSVSAFGANSTQFNWNATAGNHTITVVADSTGSIAEDNETNNEASTTMYVQDITPPSILNLVTKRGSLVMKLNISDNVNIASVSALVNITTIQFTFNSTSGLWEGSSQTIGPGTYPAAIIVMDSSGLVTTAKSSITVYPDSVDIALPKGSIVLSPSNPLDGKNASINVNVFNYGLNQTPNFVVELLIDGTFQANKTFSVPGDSNSTTQFSWTAKYGNHTFIAKIDTNNSILEINESNNEFNITVFVQDAQVPTINKVIIPEIVYESSPITVKANVTDNLNVSQVNATVGSTTITLSYNQTSQLYENSTTLPAAGLSNITVKASNPNHLTSSSESLLMVYGTSADLMVDFGGVKLSPDNITESNILTINATVENRGGTDANNFKVELLIDGVSQKNSTFSISKASTFVVNFNWTSTYGNHNVTIRLDRDSSIAESNESNNEYNRTVFVSDVTAPAAVQNFIATPSTWTNQTSIAISWNAVSDTNGIDRYEYQIDYGTWISVGTNTNFSVSSQPDGAHLINVRAVDVPGNIGNISNVTIYVDKTPPNTPIIKEWHSGSNWTQHDTPYLSWTDPGDQGSGITRFAISTDNGAESDLGYVLNYHSAQLSTGSHSFKIKSYDASNQYSNWSNSITVYIDRSLPANPLTLTSPTHLNSSKWYKENNVVFNWSVPNDNSGIYGYYYAIDRVNDTVPDSVSLWTTNTTINISEVIAPQIAANGSNETNFTGLADGTWYFHVVSRDNTGNVGTNVSHLTVKIDSKMPSILNLTPLNNSIIENKTPFFKIDYIDGGSGVNVSSVTLIMDGTVVNSTKNETTLTYTPTSNLSNGIRTATVNITDNASNTNTFSWQFSIGNFTLRVQNTSVADAQGNKRIFEFAVNNYGESNLSGFSWNLNTGIDVINSNLLYNLAVNESIFVFNEYNYSRTGDFMVTASANDGISQASESIFIDIEDIELSNLSVLNESGTKKIFEFVIENKLSTNLTNVSWVFDTKNSNVINGTKTTTLQPNEEMFIYIDYNFTTTGTYNVNASARNGTLIDSRNLTVTI